MKPIVVIELNTKTRDRKVHAFIDAPVVIGRGMQADVSLDAEHVSILHGSLLDERGVLVYVDHDSRNGTFADDRRLKSDERIVVKNETRLRIGEFVLAVSREVPDGVVPKKTSSGPKDASVGVAAPPTAILSRSSFDLLSRGQSLASPTSVEKSAQVAVVAAGPSNDVSKERVSLAPIAAELMAPKGPVAVPLPRASPPSVEVSDPGPVAVVGPSPGLTKTLMAKDVPGLVEAIARGATAPLAGTPFPGRHAAWFVAGDDIALIRSERPASARVQDESAWPSRRLLKFAAAVAVGATIGTVAAKLLHG